MNSNYELIQQKDVKDLNSKGLLYKHKKSGARVLILANDDENKVFSVSFKTPPSDDTGVPHIIEHSVLCGSEKFPIKDPFVELIKGSLNTFLNAMTFNDKTMYPIASCNDKDFKNLMHVYMDAVFYPNIYKEEKIFRQEGWSYELESLEDELKINGVVYNEMKGVFSSPEDVLEREILYALFPDNCYGYESGGSPDAIPDLTYENFLDFHRRFYHPVNSYIFLYGNMDYEERLDWLDKEYLSKFDKIELDSHIDLQKSFDKMQERKAFYPVSEPEEEQDNTYISYNLVIGDNLNKENYVAFEVLDYALFTMPGAPIKQRLLDAGICKDVITGYNSEVLQPYYTITLKYCDEASKDKFLEIINEEFERIIKEGVDKDAFLAGINQYEFKFREADFGTYPKGLVYAMNSMESWLYDDNEPFIHLELADTFKFLKEELNNGFFENLIKKYFCNNPHSALVILCPKAGLATKKEEEVKEKLAKLKASLSKEELEKLVRETKEAVEFKERPDSEEALKTIPLLTREDINEDPLPFKYSLHKVEGVDTLWSDQFTGGISYLEFNYDINGIDKELIPYVGLMGSVVGYIDTKNYSYEELAKKISIHLGGLGAANSVYVDTNDAVDYRFEAEFKAKMVYDEIETGVELLKEICFNTVFDNEKRLLEIIQELKSKMQMRLSSLGNVVASLRAMSYFSETSYLSEITSGLEFYRFIDDIEKNFESKKGEVIANLNKLMEQILHKDGLTVLVIADKEGFEKTSKALKSYLDKVPESPKPTGRFKFELKKLNEGFKFPGQVQFVSRAGNFKKAGFNFTGSLLVLKKIMNYEYMWTNIRVIGGAYGCGSVYTRTGDSFFMSYRDPNLEKTNEVFEGMPEYIKNFEVSERDMTKYVIGTISDMDTPLTASMKGMRDLSAYMANLGYDRLKKERMEVINTKAEDIRALAPLIQSILDEESICVVGNETKINENADLFDKIENLM